MFLKCEQLTALPTIICTDVEPDDIAAIVLLHCNIKFKKLLFVVGEHDNPEYKCRLLASLLAKLVPSYDALEIEYVTGAGTEQPFPVIETTDGVNIRPNPRPAFNVIAKFIGNAPGQECNVISIKPPRDLLSALDIDSELFKKCHLFAYGSYNIRCVLNSDYYALHEIDQLYNDAFDSVLLLEAKQLLNPDSVCKSDGIQFAEPLQSLIVAWNDSIVKKMSDDIRNYCTAEVAALLDCVDSENFMESVSHLPEAERRNFEIIHKVTCNEECNMVLADAALAACMISSTDNVPTAAFTFHWNQNSRCAELKPPRPDRHSVRAIYSNNDAEKQALRRMIIDKLQSCTALIHN